MSHTLPTVPVTASGLEGWTSCCDAAVTYSDTALCCKNCWHEVEPVDVDDVEQSAKLAEVIMAVLQLRMTPDDGVAAQHELFGDV